MISISSIKQNQNLRVFYNNNKFFILVSIFFIITRLIIFIIDIKPNLLWGYWQLLDNYLLQNDLLKSLFYLHSEPILWNLIIGVGLKLFPSHLELALHIFHILLSYVTFCYFFLILKIINFPKKYFLVILIFFILSPNIIYYENWIFYSHLSYFLFFQISYFFFKYFENYNIKYQIYIYVSLLLLTLLWKLFHPVLFIIFFFIFVYFSDQVKLKKFFTIFIIFFSLSLLPVIKNKIAFGFYTNGGLLGLNIAQTTKPYLSHYFITENKKKIECNFNNLEKNEDDFYSYFKINKSQLNHPSIVGKMNSKNNVGGIYRSKKCLDVVIKNILQNPVIFLKSRMYNLILSHSKLAIDHGFSPKGWHSIFPIKELKKNIFIKYFMGFFTLIYIFLIYAYVIYYLFRAHDNLFIKKTVSVIFIFYLYIIVIGHLFNGWEQERFLYTGFVIQLLAVSLFVKQLVKKNEKNHSYYNDK